MAFDLVLSNTYNQFDLLNLDLSLNNLMDLSILNGNNFIIQEVQKILFTIQGSYFFDSNYGSTIREFIGDKIFNPSDIENSIAQSIQDSITNLILNQSKIPFLTMDETIQGIQLIQVSYDAETNITNNPNSVMTFDVLIQLIVGTNIVSVNNVIMIKGA
jgi:phage baseplate assembly protein W